MRPGGNPDLIEHQLKCQIGDKPAEVLGVRVPAGTKSQLAKKYGKNYAVKLREAIAKLLDD